MSTRRSVSVLQRAVSHHRRRRLLLPEGQQQPRVVSSWNGPGRRKTGSSSSGAGGSRRAYSSRSSEDAGTPIGLHERLQHPMPHKIRAGGTGTSTSSSSIDPSTIWDDYAARYQTLAHGTSFEAQRTKEQRWKWNVLVPNFLNTSPVALRGAFWHALYCAVIILPHQLFHYHVDPTTVLDVPPELLPWMTDVLTFVEPFVMSHDLVSGDLLATFSIYSTALFLIVSMRLTGAMTYQRDGHQYYCDLVTETLKVSQKVQLYCTDPTTASEISVWSYIAVRATELHLQNVHDPAVIRATLAPLLLTAERRRKTATTQHIPNETTHPPTTLRRIGGTTTVIKKEEEHEVEHQNPDEDTSAAVAHRATDDDAVLQQLLRVGNKPLFALQHMTTLCHAAFDRAAITNIRALIDIYASIGNMTTAFQRCVQLQAAPEPYSYNLSMKIFLQLWVGILPLVLVPSLHLWTIPMSTTLAFFVYKLDEISAELQNPYGHDASDIALGTINDRLQQDLSQMLVVYDQSRSRTRMDGNFPLEQHTNLDEPLGEPGAGDWADNEKLIKQVGLGTLSGNNTP